MSFETHQKAVRDAKLLLAKLHHPDKVGGDADAMKAVNILADAAANGHNWDAVDFDDVTPQADVCAEGPDESSDASYVDAGDGYVPLILNGVEIPREAAAALRALPKAEYAE